MRSIYLIVLFISFVAVVNGSDDNNCLTTLRLNHHDKVYKFEAYDNYYCRFASEVYNCALDIYGDNITESTRDRGNAGVFWTSCSDTSIIFDGSWLNTYYVCNLTNIDTGTKDQMLTCAQIAFDKAGGLNTRDVIIILSFIVGYCVIYIACFYIGYRNTRMNSRDRRMSYIQNLYPPDRTRRESKRVNKGGFNMTSV